MNPGGRQACTDVMDIRLPIIVGLAALAAAAATPTVPTAGSRASPGVLFHVGTNDPVVALTIDDGPSVATPEILEVLAENEGRATFFVTGEQVRAHPDLTRRLVAEGHELGHHMMIDEPSIDLPQWAFRERFEEMDGILDEFGGSTLFRPASGWYNDRMVDEAARLGYRTVLGLVYPFDAQIPFPTLSTWYMRQLTVPGSILILHDGPERGPRTATVLRTLLPGLRAQGIRVVPVSDLARLERPPPGAERTGTDDPGGPSAQRPLP